MKCMCPWYFNLIFILYTYNISREDWKSFSSDWLNKKKYEKIVSAIANATFSYLLKYTNIQNAHYQSNKLLF